MTHKRYAIIVAGGSGSRMQSDVPKQFIFLKNKPIMAHSINKFIKCGCEIILVLPKAYINTFKEEVLPHCAHQDFQIVSGGETRFESVKNGLALVAEENLVAVHDAVRPFIEESIIEESFEKALKFGSAVAAVELKDSIRLIKENGSESKNRSNYRLIQTPQTFKSSLLLKAYKQAYQSSFTDDASVFEADGNLVHLINGDFKNIKITTPEDLLIANALMQ